MNDYGMQVGAGECVLYLAETTNATVNNFKAYSFTKWSDGIDTYSASNISINNYFAAHR